MSNQFQAQPGFGRSQGITQSRVFGNSQQTKQVSFVSQQQELQNQNMNTLNTISGTGTVSRGSNTPLHNGNYPIAAFTGNAPTTSRTLLGQNRAVQIDNIDDQDMEVSTNPHHNHHHRAVVHTSSRDVNNTQTENQYYPHQVTSHTHHMVNHHEHDTMLDDEENAVVDINQEEFQQTEAQLIQSVHNTIQQAQNAGVRFRGKQNNLERIEQAASDSSMKYNYHNNIYINLSKGIQEHQSSLELNGDLLHQFEDAAFLTESLLEEVKQRDIASRNTLNRESHNTKQLLAEILHVEDYLHHVQQQTLQYQSILPQLRARVAQMQPVIPQQQKQIQELEMAIQQLVDEQKNAQLSIKHFNSKFAELSQLQHDAEQKLTTVSTLREENDAKVLSCNSQLSRINTLSTTLIALFHNIQNIVRGINLSKEYVENLNNTINTLKDDISTKQEETVGFSQQYTQYQFQIQQVEMQNQTLQSHIEDDFESLDMLELAADQLQDLQQQVEDQTQKYEQAQQQFDELTAQNSNLVEQHRITIADTQNKLVELKASAGGHDIDNFLQQVVTLEIKLQSLNDKLTTDQGILTKLIEEYQTHFNEHTAELDNLQEQMKSKEELILQQNELLQTLQQQLAATQAEADRLIKHAQLLNDRYELQQQATVYIEETNAIKIKHTTKHQDLLHDLLELEKELLEELHDLEVAETERLAEENAEADRLEAQRIEKEKADAALLEAKRLQEEKAELERLAAEKIEAARLEAQRLAQEKIESERLAKEEEIARLQAQLEAAQKIQAEKKSQETSTYSSSGPIEFPYDTTDAGMDVQMLSDSSQQKDDNDNLDDTKKVVKGKTSKSAVVALNKQPLRSSLRNTTSTSSDNSGDSGNTAKVGGVSFNENVQFKSPQVGHLGSSNVTSASQGCMTSPDSDAVRYETMRNTQINVNATAILRRATIVGKKNRMSGDVMDDDDDDDDEEDLISDVVQHQEAKETSSQHTKKINTKQSTDTEHDTSVQTKKPEKTNLSMQQPIVEEVEEEHVINPNKPPKKKSTKKSKHTMNDDTENSDDEHARDTKKVITKTTTTVTTTTVKKATPVSALDSIQQQPGQQNDAFFFSSPPHGEDDMFDSLMQSGDGNGDDFAMELVGGDSLASPPQHENVFEAVFNKVKTGHNNHSSQRQEKDQQQQQQHRTMMDEMNDYIDNAVVPPLDVSSQQQTKKQKNVNKDKTDNTKDSGKKKQSSKKTKDLVDVNTEIAAVQPVSPTSGSSVIPIAKSNQQPPYPTHPFEIGSPATRPIPREIARKDDSEAFDALSRALPSTPKLSTPRRLSKAQQQHISSSDNESYGTPHGTTGGNASRRQTSNLRKLQSPFTPEALLLQQKQVAFVNKKGKTATDTSLSSPAAIAKAKLAVLKATPNSSAKYALGSNNNDDGRNDKNDDLKKSKKQTKVTTDTTTTKSQRKITMDDASDNHEDIPKKRGGNNNNNSNHNKQQALTTKQTNVTDYKTPRQTEMQNTRHISTTTNNNATATLGSLTKPPRKTTATVSQFRTTQGQQQQQQQGQHSFQGLRNGTSAVQHKQNYANDTSISNHTKKAARNAINGSYFDDDDNDNTAISDVALTLQDDHDSDDDGENIIGRINSQQSPHASQHHPIVQQTPRVGNSGARRAAYIEQQSTVHKLQTNRAGGGMTSIKQTVHPILSTKQSAFQTHVVPHATSLATKVKTIINPLSQSTVTSSSSGLRGNSGLQPRNAFGQPPLPRQQRLHNTQPNIIQQQQQLLKSQASTSSILPSGMRQQNRGGFNTQPGIYAAPASVLGTQSNVSAVKQIQRQAGNNNGTGSLLAPRQNAFSHQPPSRGGLFRR